MLIKPLALMDLDDTLFQTAKHLPLSVLKHVATLDKNGQPLAFMTDTQLQFWQWLNASTEVIPVTARSVSGLARVQIEFSSWVVCQHGAVILSPSGVIDVDWAAHMNTQLARYQSDLASYCVEIMQAAQPFTDVRAWVTDEFEQSIYIIVKKSANNDVIFKQIIDSLKNSPRAADYYIHINGNTMAVLPHVVSKQSAVAYLLQRIQHDSARPIIGWGDSLSDLPFLQHCDWWGMPKRAQASQWFNQKLTQHVQQEGAYEFINTAHA